MFFKFLELFILKNIFSKDEYNFNSKNFKPLKLFTIIFLVLNLFFTIFLLNKFIHIYKVVKTECPRVLEKEEKKVININIKPTDK
ncbi:MAG: hypothetical protein ACD_33C00014G0007 [uncultured bacterium]|nr:MAG: hypothetical protein ACD_33C00014G0007 [uncultured bacterium]